MKIFVTLLLITFQFSVFAEKPLNPDRIFKKNKEAYIGFIKDLKESNKVIKPFAGISGRIKLPEKYKHLSQDGMAYVYGKAPKEPWSIQFYIDKRGRRGDPNPSIAIWYDENKMSKKPIKTVSKKIETFWFSWSSW